MINDMEVKYVKLAFEWEKNEGYRGTYYEYRNIVIVFNWRVKE